MYSRFDIEKIDTGYKSNLEYTNDILNLIAMYLSIALNIKREFAIEKDGVHLNGISVNSADAVTYVDTFLNINEEISEERRENLEAAILYIESRVEATEKGLLQLENLKNEFGLTEFEFFCIKCSLACHIDKGFQKMFSLFHDIKDFKCPSFGVVKSLFQFNNKLENRELLRIIDRDSTLYKYFLKGEPKEDILIDNIINLNLKTINYINSNFSISTKIRGFCTEFNFKEDKCDEIIAYEEEFEKLRNFYSKINVLERKTLVCLIGPFGIGKRSSLKKLAVEEKKNILFIDFNKFLEHKENLRDLLQELRLECRVERKIICIHNVKNIEEEDNIKLHNFIKVLLEENNVIFLTSLIEKIEFINSDFLTFKFKYDYPNYNQSVKLWKKFLEEYDLEKGVSIEELSNNQVLTPIQIKNSIEKAYLLSIAENSNNIISKRNLYSSIKSVATNALNKVSSKLKSDFTWQDLVAGNNEKEILHNFCNRIKHRKSVYEKWYAGKKLAYGSGISLLLHGSPGTGKTMAAYVISNELNMDLYRISLSQIVSKYIGETSKNIDKIFDEAKNNNIILFFDEADSLFSKRTEVNNSNDRYANSDSAHLLQKIEEFNGVTILATNLIKNFDDAFKRRINYIVNMRLPNKAERLNIWKSVFPKEVTISNNVDYEFLAENFELSGSDIKSIAIQANYFAVEENEEISMSHLAKSIKYHLIKCEKIFSKDLFDYYIKS